MSNNVSYESDGGGLYNAGNVSLVSTTVSGNTLPQGGDGAGLYNAGNASLVSTTFSGKHLPERKWKWRGDRQ